MFEPSRHRSSGGRAQASVDPSRRSNDKPVATISLKPASPTMWGSGVGGEGSGVRGARARSIHSTSCHAPNLYPIPRYVPTGVKPTASCSRALGGFGSVMPAYAFLNPCATRTAKSDVYSARPTPLLYAVTATYAETSTDH